MVTVKEYLAPIHHRRNHELAEKLGLALPMETLNGPVTTKVYQALGTNALINKAIESLFEWHGGLIFDEKWLETPESILRLRRYGISEDNIITLFQNRALDLDEDLMGTEDLDELGFSNDQAKKYSSMMQRGNGHEESDIVEVSVRDYPKDSLFAKTPKGKISRSAMKSDSIEVLRELDLDSIIEPLEENGSVLRYLDRFCDVIAKDSRFSETLAIFILKTRVPKPISKFIIEIERSKVDVTLKEVVKNLRKSEFCIPDLIEAKKKIFFHYFTFGMDPQEYLNTISEAIYTVLPRATDVLKAFIIINLLPEEIKWQAIYDVNPTLSVDQVSTLLVQKTPKTNNGKRKHPKNYQHEGYQENNEYQQTGSDYQKNARQSVAKNYRGKKRLNNRGYRNSCALTRSDHFKK